MSRISILAGTGAIPDPSFPPGARLRREHRRGAQGGGAGGHPQERAGAPGAQAYAPEEGAPPGTGARADLAPLAPPDGGRGDRPRGAGGRPALPAAARADILRAFRCSRIAVTKPAWADFMRENTSRPAISRDSTGSGGEARTALTQVSCARQGMRNICCRVIYLSHDVVRPRPVLPAFALDDAEPGQAWPPARTARLAARSPRRGARAGYASSASPFPGVRCPATPWP